MLMGNNEKHVLFSVNKTNVLVDFAYALTFMDAAESIELVYGWR